MSKYTPENASLAEAVAKAGRIPEGCIPVPRSLVERWANVDAFRAPMGAAMELRTIAGEMLLYADANVAATLRQQAWRVDEDVRDLIEDWRAAANAHDELSYACCGEVGRRCADELEAALAQNTQGEAVAWAELCEGPNGHRYWTHSGYTNDLPLGRYYLHAELEAAVMDKQRLDWAEDHAHALDWDLHDPMKRVVRGHDGAEFCGDTWRELIDQAMRNSAREGL